MSIEIDRAGKTLLARFGRIPATFRLIPTYNGYTLTVTTRKVKFRTGEIRTTGLRQAPRLSRPDVDVPLAGSHRAPPTGDAGDARIAGPSMRAVHLRVR